jgi:hypothetical protein
MNRPPNEELDRLDGAGDRLRVERSSMRHPAATVAAPSPHPTARASKHRGPRPLSRSQTWPWGGSARRRRCRQKSIDLMRPRYWLRLGAAIPVERRPNASESRQGSIVVKREPHDILFLGLRVWLRRVAASLFERTSLRLCVARRMHNLAEIATVLPGRGATIGERHLFCGLFVLCDSPRLVFHLWDPRLLLRTGGETC